MVEPQATGQEYKVVRVTDAWEPTIEGGRIPTKLVTYQTPFGEFHTISIPSKDFNEENVKKAIRAEEQTREPLMGKTLKI